MFYLQNLIDYKGSASRAKCQIYLSISEAPPNFKLRSRLKLVQERNLIYLSISEAPPNFKLRSRLKLVQERNLIYLSI